MNDSGFGVGVANDLENHPFYNDKDKYLRTIQDAVSLTWGNNILVSYVDVRFDPENKDKDIVIVKVRPLENGIDYDGVWWVKSGNSKRRLDEDDYRDYRAAHPID